MQDPAGRMQPHLEELRALAEQIHSSTDALTALADGVGVDAQFVEQVNRDLREPLNSIIGFSSLLLAEVRDDGQRDAIEQIQSSGREMLDALERHTATALGLDGPGGRGTPPAAPPVVVVIDPSQSTTTLVTRALQDDGFEVVTAADADTGFEAAAAARPDVLLLSLDIPDDDPLARLASLGAGDLAGIPVVAMTSDATDERGERAIAAGAALHLRKPLDITALPAVLHGVMRASAATPAAATPAAAARPATPSDPAPVVAAAHHDVPGGPSREAGAGSPVDIIEPPAVRSGTGMARGVIVIADDNDDLRSGIGEGLSRLGYTVVATRDGKAALDEVRRRRPAAAVLDWMMPEIEGAEVCRLLKQDPATAGVPVVVLTGRTAQADIERAFRSGADEYLTKPFDMIELERMVDRLTAQAPEAGQEG